MMKIFKSCKGGVSAYILSLFLAICLIIPMLLVIIQRQAVFNSIAQVQDCINMTAHSAYMALIPNYYTDKLIRLDDIAFQEKFTNLLNENLTQSFGESKIVEIMVYNENLPMRCSGGENFYKPGVHVIVKMTLPAPAYHLLVPSQSNGKVDINVHKDIQFSVVD